MRTRLIPAVAAVLALSAAGAARAKPPESCDPMKVGCGIGGVPNGPKAGVKPPPPMPTNDISAPHARPKPAAGVARPPGPRVRGAQLNPGEALAANEQLQSRTVEFRMQGDCNLVAYREGGAVWSSKTNGRGRNCRAVMQADGNLVLYDGGGRALWASGTNHFPGGRLVAQDDGNVVIYTGATPRWSTNTWIRR